ncbi:MAG: hypothetical protein HYV63_17650 [Candidatus Schekmanbacteria bacterium]|nr:hypothetical protein [Candidatus Schekmanbacteria bacterium]
MVEREAEPAMTRRTFLRRGAATAVVFGALRTTAAARSDEVDGEPGSAPQALSRRAFKVLAAVAAVLVGDLDAAAAARVARRIDAELTCHGDWLRRDVTDALLLIEYLAVVTRGRAFSRLAAEDRRTRLLAMSTSRFALSRAAFQGIKVLVCFFYYTCDETWPQIGYDGPWVARAKPASVA